MISWQLDDLALRLQALADEEQREAFEAGRQTTLPTLADRMDCVEPGYKHPTFDNYLKSKEER